MAAGDATAEMTPIDVVDRFPNLATAEEHEDAHGEPGRRCAPISLEGSAAVRPVFAAKGSVTAGNSLQTSDGAGALILASEKAIKQYDLAAGALRQLRCARRGAGDRWASARSRRSRPHCATPG